MRQAGARVRPNANAFWRALAYRQRVEEESNMAERQETSVMVSIQEILRDAQSREEQEKVEAERRAREEEQRRIEEIRRRQEEEQARLKAEEDDKQRRVFEEEKRKAELQAVQDAAIQRAKTEAEAKARLAEMTARQEHERQLHALSQDKHKKRLQFFLVGLGILLFGGAIGGGMLIKQNIDKANLAAARANELQGAMDQAESQKRALQAELENTKDPEKIAALQAQLAEQQQKLTSLQSQRNEPRRVTGGGGGAAPAAKPAGGGGGAGKPCNCTPGDPLCSCL